MSFSRSSADDVEKKDLELHSAEVEPLQDAHLQRALSARQVQMIAIGMARERLKILLKGLCAICPAGTIGTGLFLGTGKSLATGGPASLLITYSIIGFIVYITLLLLGEMSTQYPVAGSFNVFASRFVDDAYGFALSWNCEHFMKFKKSFRD